MSIGSLLWVGAFVVNLAFMFYYGFHLSSNTRVEDGDGWTLPLLLPSDDLTDLGRKYRRKLVVVTVAQVLVVLFGLVFSPYLLA